MGLKGTEVVVDNDFGTNIGFRGCDDEGRIASVERWVGRVM